MFLTDSYIGQTTKTFVVGCEFDMLDVNDEAKGTGQVTQQWSPDSDYAS